MDESKCKEWIEANLPKLQQEFGLEEWRVNVHYKDAGETGNYHSAASITRDEMYHRAEIEINPLQFTDEELPGIIEHELLHLIHSPFDNFETILYPGLKPGMAALVREAEIIAHEQSVRNLEKLVKRLREVMG